MPLGLSSLGRCEARVLPNLDSVIASLARIVDTDEVVSISHPRAAAFYREAPGDRVAHPLFDRR